MLSAQCGYLLSSRVTHIEMDYCRFLNSFSEMFENCSVDRVYSQTYITICSLQSVTAFVVVFRLVTRAFLRLCKMFDYIVQLGNGIFYIHSPSAEQGQSFDSYSVSYVELQFAIYCGCARRV